MTPLETLYQHVLDTLLVRAGLQADAFSVPHPQPAVVAAFAD